MKFRHLPFFLMMLAATLAWHLSPARAQGLAPPSTGPIQIVAVTPTDPSPTESRLVLSFNQQLPQFSVVNNDGATAVLAFADAFVIVSAVLGVSALLVLMLPQLHPKTDSAEAVTAAPPALTNSAAAPGSR